MKSTVLILTFLFTISIILCMVSIPTALAESGRQIDIYTQYAPPHGGQGANQPSNPFRPSMEVILYAKATYNDWPTAQRTISYRIQHGIWDFTLSGTTNSSGIASAKFTIPWLGDETETQVLGIWNTTATVNIAEQTVKDALWFYVLFSDLNSDGKIDVRDMVIVAAAYGSDPTMPKWNPIADVNHDGKVDIYDLTIVAKDYGWQM